MKSCFSNPRPRTDSATGLIWAATAYILDDVGSGSALAGCVSMILN